MAATSPLPAQTQTSLSMELGAIVEEDLENRAKLQRTTLIMSPFISKYPDREEEKMLDQSLKAVVDEDKALKMTMTQVVTSAVDEVKPKEENNDEATWQRMMLIRQNVVKAAGMQDKRRLRTLALMMRDLRVDPGKLMETGLPRLLRDTDMWSDTKAEAIVSTTLTRWMDEIKAKTCKDPDWLQKPKDPPMRGLKCRNFVAVVDVMEAWLKNDRVDDKWHEYRKLAY